MKNAKALEWTHKQRYVRRSFEFRSAFVAFVWALLEAIDYFDLGMPLGTSIARVDLNIWAVRFLCMTEIFLFAPYYACVGAFPEREDLAYFLTVLVDVIVLTCFIHYLGGIHSSFLPCLYLFVILYASGVFPRNQILWITAACSVSYIALFWFEFFEWIPHAILNRTELRPLHYLIRLVVALCTVWIGGFIAIQVVNVLSEKKSLVHLGTFFAGLAHELRTPLAIILNEVALLQKRQQGPELDIIKGQADRLSNLLDQILSYTEEQRLDLAPLDLRGTVDKAASYVIKSLEEGKVRNIEVVKDYHHERVEILGDDVQLQQGFINLIRNAIEAMHYEGKLTIRVGIYNVFWAQAEILDEGMGMSKEVLAQAFEPFFTTKQRGRGTGLGLPITRRIIDDHQGNIVVMSEEGSGTTIRIQIPLRS